MEEKRKEKKRREGKRRKEIENRNGSTKMRCERTSINKARIKKKRRK